MAKLPVTLDRFDAIAIQSQVATCSEQFMQIESHNAPNREVIGFFDHSGWIDRVFSNQLHNAATLIQTLDRKFAVEHRKHDAVVFGLDAAVN